MPDEPEGDRALRAAVKKPTYCSFTVFQGKRENLCNWPTHFTSPYFRPQTLPPLSTLISLSSVLLFLSSHLVLSQGQVGFFWNEGPLFLNGPIPSPVSFCGDEYAVSLQSGIPFLCQPSSPSLGNPTLISY